MSHVARCTEISAPDSSPWRRSCRSRLRRSPRRRSSPHGYNSTPRIDGFDVVSVRQLSAGNDLLFTLYGSPGGTATVQIGGATGRLLLDEIEAGVYEGAYTISSPRPHHQGQHGHGQPAPRQPGRQQRSR